MDSIRYRLGLDVGSTSLGWWIWEEDEAGEVVRSVDGGVSIYSDSRNPKTGISNAAGRRVARGMRRRRDRYLKRRSRLMSQLIEFGLMPSDSSERKNLEKLDPYKCRVRALDKQLRPYELGRALFHLNQRRGFKSNRIIDSASDQGEQGMIRGGISTLNEALEKNNCRTIGEFLYKKHKSKNLLRFRPGVSVYPSRDHYQEEFKRIRSHQEPLHTLAAEDWDSLADTIFHQRPLRPVEPGKCTLFPDQERAPHALPVCQQFRLLQETNNLKVIQVGEMDRFLTAEERNLTFEILSSQAKVRFNSLRKKLNLRLDSRFNLEDEKRKHLDGDATAAVLRKDIYFGKKWDTWNLDDQTLIVRDLLTIESENDLQSALQDRWNLSNETVRKLATVRLPQGYGKVSEQAMEELIPHLKGGLRYHEAVKAAFPDIDHSMVDSHHKVDLLPYYPVLLERHVSKGTNRIDDDTFKRLGKISNPTVHVGLNRIRRIVNAIIEKYGPPTKITVELARDLKNSFEEKQKIIRRQAKEREKNEQRRIDLEQCGLEPNPGYLRKVRLWEEQGPAHARCCPYCGCILSYEMVLGDRTEIDHILPFSQTLDDSLSNKVVCCTSCNRIKGNRTPFEAFGSAIHDKFDYENMKYRISSNWPFNKKWRFYPDAMDRYENEENGFLARQLNDTRYLSRITKTYLEYLCDEPSQVSVTPGNLTALIRWKWGLNDVLGDSNLKNRADHRHHAIDAAVIALIDRSMLQRVSSAAAAGVDVNRFLPKMPEPSRCRNFRNQIRDHALHRLIVVHRPRHIGVRSNTGSTSGQLHNDTAFGIVAGPNKTGSYTVVRSILLSGLQETEGTKLLSGKAKRKVVRDDRLREKLLEIWLSFSDEGQSWKDFCEYASEPGRVSKNGVRKLRCTETKDSLIEIQDRNGTRYKGFKPASNARLDIFKYPNGKFKGHCISMYEANQKLVKPSLPKQPSHAECVSHLSQNDLVAVGEGKNREFLRVVKLSGNSVCCAPHFEGGNLDARHKDPNDPFSYYQTSSTKLVQAGLRRVKVDPIGTVYDPGPIERTCEK